MAYLGVKPAGITSATQVETDKLNVDNVQIDGNTISSTDTNGNIMLDPNGTGNVGIGMTPSRPLHVQASSGAAGIGVRGRSSDGTATLITHEDASGNAENSITGYTTHLRIDAGTASDAGHTMQFYVNDAESMRIDSSGALLIGKTSLTSSDAGLELNTGATANVARVDHHKTASGDFAGYYFFHNGSNVGGIDYSNSAVNYATSSDHRLKENVADMTGAITRVKALTPKRFNFIIDPDTTVDGFLAHEAQTVVPEAVRGTHNEVDEDGNAVMQGIDQSKLVPLLTGALKEAIAKIEALEARVTALEDA